MSICSKENIDKFEVINFKEVTLLGSALTS